MKSAVLLVAISNAGLWHIGLHTIGPTRYVWNAELITPCKPSVRCYGQTHRQGEGLPVGVAAAGMRPLLAFTPKASSAFSSVTSCSHIFDSFRHCLAACTLISTGD